MNTTISLVSPYLDRWRAARDPGDDVDEHTHWTVSYGTVPIESPSGAVWPVVGTLHAAGSGGWGDISVAAFVKNADDIATEEFEAVLGGSEAIETLYDFARSHFVPMLAGIDADIDLPKKSPDPQMMSYDPDNDVDRSIEKDSSDG